MTECPHVVGPEEPVQAAREKMGENSIRHLPVVDDEGNLVGVVSERDIALLESLDVVELDECHVRDAMREGPFTCGPEAHLHMVASEMLEHRYGSTIVVDPEPPRGVLGIFTTSDAMRAIVQLTQPYLRDPGMPPE